MTIFDINLVSMQADVTDENVLEQIDAEMWISYLEANRFDRVNLSGNPSIVELMRGMNEIVTLRKNLWWDERCEHNKTVLKKVATLLNKSQIQIIADIFEADPNRKLQRIRELADIFEKDSFKSFLENVDIDTEYMWDFEASAYLFKEDSERVSTQTIELMKSLFAKVENATLGYLHDKYANGDSFQRRTKKLKKNVVWFTTNSKRYDFGILLNFVTEPSHYQWVAQAILKIAEMANKSFLTVYTDIWDYQHI